MNKQSLRFFIAPIFYFIFTFHIAAADSTYNQKGTRMLSFNAMPGFLWGHKENIINVQGHNIGYSLSLSRVADSSRWWHKHYGFPRTGLSFYYNAFGNNEILGKVFAALPFFEFNILKKQRSAFVFRLGTGLGYHTKKFDVETNYKNKVIGSTFNTNMFAGLIYHRAIGKYLEGDIGLSLCHFSNAHLKEPNYGINMPSIFAGLGYRLSPKVRKPKNAYPDTSFGTGVHWTLPPLKRHHFQAQLMLTKKEELSSFSQIFWIKGLFLSYAYQKSQISKWTTGVDLWLDKTYFYKTHVGASLAGVSLDRQLEAGIRAGHELRAGRLCLITDLGVYVYKPADFKKRIYERLGLRYYLLEHLFIGSSLKVHYGRADYMEFNLGVDL